jgi:hypothetical protein
MGYLGTTYAAPTGLNPISGMIHIFNYANTSTNKTTLARFASDQNGSGFTALSVGLWRNTAAISSLNISTGNGSIFWAAGTTVNLYGIRAVR